MSNFRYEMRYMNPYDIHKALINEYILKRPGDTKLLKRDFSRDRTDFDVIKENHRFLWDNQELDNWESQFAKKYYDKLFKEYCIGDLSRYKENKIALRWRIEQEVIDGKGQFICANKKCSEKLDLRTWEVNFAYEEHGEKKNALVKIRLCPDCSSKLNYHTKKREIKRLKRKQELGSSPRSKNKHKAITELDKGYCLNDEPGTSRLHEETGKDEKILDTSSSVIAESPWENLKPVETKSREEEMEEYLQELLL